MLGLISAWVIATISPGPDMLMVMQQSMTRSRSAGLQAGFGVVAGLILWVLLAIFGLRTLLGIFPALVEWLQIAGGVVLIVMGVLSISGASHDVGAVRARSLPPFALGMATNLANPKAVVFFGAIFTPLLAQGLAPLSIALLVCFLLCISVAWFSAVAFAADALPLGRMSYVLSIVAGVLFIAIGLGFIFT